MTKYSFDHIHLMSPDPVKTGEFYEKMFGATPVLSKDLGNGRYIVSLKLGEVTILISKTSPGTELGLAHFGFKTNKLNEAVPELKSKGVNFTTEIKQINPTLKVSFFQAPENVTVELQEGGF